MPTEESDIWISDAKYDTFWRRFGASLIDAAIIVIGLRLIAGIPVDRGTLIAVWPTLSLSIRLTYSVGLHALYGQTVGKRVAKVRVVDVSERPLSFKQAVLRDSPDVVVLLVYVAHLALSESSAAFLPISMLMVLSAVGPLWGIAEILTMRMNDKRRAIHDFLAGSVVVRTGAA